MFLKRLMRVAVVFATLLGTTAVTAKIPHENFYVMPSYGNLSLSPNGKYMAGGKIMDNGELHGFIWQRRTGELVSEMKLADEYGLQKITWVDNERVLLQFGVDSEMYEGMSPVGLIAAMNVDGERKRIIWSGVTSDYGGFEGGGLVNKIDKDHYLIQVYPSGSGMRKFPYVYFYRLNIETGKSKKLYRSPIRAAKPIIKKGKDGEEEITHWVGMLPDSFRHVVVAEKQQDGSWKETVYDPVEGEFTPLMYHKDGKALLYRDTFGGPTRGLVSVDLETKEKTLIYRHPHVDYTRTLRDDDGNFWGASIEYDYPKTIYFDEDNYYAQVQKKMEATFKNHRIDIVSKTADGNEWLIHVRSDKILGKYYIYNEFDGSLKFVANRAPQIDPSEMTTDHAVRFQARDGLTIPAYITTPNGWKPGDKKLPLIMLTHGGPHGIRDNWGAFERAIWANEGYAVMAVNYRGSGGFGRDFLYDWYGHWGLEMQDDITDATHWAIEQGIADPDRVCLYGASYGGYASLMGVVREPDLYKCTIGYVGVYDLNVMMETGDVSLRHAGVKYLEKALGGTYEKRKAQSPAPNAHKIKAPVFLMHGDLDYRAHFKNYEVMRDALKAQNHRFETLRIPKAGHGARNAKSRLEIHCRMKDFFERHIGDNPDPMRPPVESCHQEGETPLPYVYYKGQPRG